MQAHYKNPGRAATEPHAASVATGCRVQQAGGLQPPDTAVPCRSPARLAL